MEVQTTGCDIRDRALARAGEDLIEWAAREMPVLRSIRDRFAAERPLQGQRVSACLHVTSATANLVLTLQARGAGGALPSSYPRSPTDDRAARLRHHSPRSRVAH